MDYQTICHLQAWIVKQHGSHETDSALFALHGLMVAECENDPEHYCSRGWWSLYDAVNERHPDWRND